MRASFLSIVFYLIFLAPTEISAQYGYSIVDSCYDNYNSIDIIYSRSISISTDTGLYLLYQHRDPTDTVWQSGTSYPMVYYGNKYEYNSNKLVRLIYLRRNDSLIQDYAQTLFQYNAGGLLTDSITQEDSLGVWYNKSSWHVDRDSIGQITLLEKKQWSVGQWNNIFAEEWNYDSLGRDTLHITYNGNAASWVESSMLRKIYNGNYLIDSLLYSWSNSAWLNIYRYEHLLYSSGLDSVIIEYDGSLLGWDSISYQKLEYDTAGQIIVIQKYLYNSPHWEANRQTFIEYDTLGRVVDSVSQVYSSNAWLNQNRMYRIYLGADMDSTFRQSWNGTDWVCYETVFREEFGSPNNFHEVISNCSDCNSCTRDTDHYLSYDAYGRLVSYSYIGLSGSSAGDGFRNYDLFGFLYRQYTNSSTQGGLTHVSDCFHYHPLFSIFNNYNFSACRGDTIQLNILIFGGKSPQKFHWTPDSGILDTTSMNPKIVVGSTSKWYKLLITDARNNFFVDSFYVEVHSPQINLGSDTLICRYSTIILSAGTFDNYLWQDGSTDSLFIVQYSASTPDTSIYWVEVSDSSGCTQRDSVTVVFDICAGMNGFMSDDLSVHPNPVQAGSKLNILSQVKFEKVQLQSSVGKLIELKIENVLISIPENLSSGYYNLILYSKSLKAPMHYPVIVSGK